MIPTMASTPDLFNSPGEINRIEDTCNPRLTRRRCHLWEGSCANTLCPAAMQDGAARLLQRHLNAGSKPAEHRVFRNAYDHLTSRDPSKTWTSGQWMTERTGGSDVSQTE